MTLKNIARKNIESLFSLLGITAKFARRSPLVDYALFDRNLLEQFFLKDEKMKLYFAALEKTGMTGTDNLSKQFRHFSLQNLAEAVLKNNLAGDVAECGCWKGHSSFQIAAHMKNSGSQKTFHIFDSFEEGLSERQSEDENLRHRMSDNEKHQEKMVFSSGETQVKENLSDFPFIKYYKGWIPKRFKEVEDRSFCFVHIDVDLYQPTKDSLDFFLPRLVPGGICVIDDYGFTQFPGCKKATAETLKKFPPSFFYPISSGGAFLIK